MVSQEGRSFPSPDIACTSASGAFRETYIKSWHTGEREKVRGKREGAFGTGTTDLIKSSESRERTSRSERGKEGESVFTERARRVNQN